LRIRTIVNITRVIIPAIPTNSRNPATALYLFLSSSTSPSGSSKRSLTVDTVTAEAIKTPRLTAYNQKIM